MLFPKVVNPESLEPKLVVQDDTVHPVVAQLGGPSVNNVDHLMEVFQLINFNIERLPYLLTRRVGCVDGLSDFVGRTVPLWTSNRPTRLGDEFTSGFKRHDNSGDDG